MGEDQAMLKRMLVNTGAGQVAMTLRDRSALLKSALNDVENAGMLANDLLARNILERLCEPGGIFIDVGAHIGSVIAGVGRHSNPAHIIAIEAIPEKVVALRKNFPAAEIIETAVSDQETDADFIVDISRPGFSSLNAAVAADTLSSRTIRVKVTKLDSVVPHDGIDLIKIDVEGAELGVLRGAEAVVNGSRPTIMFESGATEMDGFPRSHLWQWFEDHDYEVTLPMRVAHTSPGLTLETFQACHYYPRITTNFYGIPKERRDEIRLRARTALRLKP